LTSDFEAMFMMMTTGTIVDGVYKLGSWHTRQVCITLHYITLQRSSAV